MVGAFESASHFYPICSIKFKIYISNNFFNKGGGEGWSFPVEGIFPAEEII